MNFPKQHTSRLAIAAVLVVGGLLGLAILQKDKPQAKEAHGEHGHAEHDHGEPQDDGDGGRGASWQAQQQRGAQSRQVARNQPSRQLSGDRAEHREFRHR